MADQTKTTKPRFYHKIAQAKYRKQSVVAVIGLLAAIGAFFVFNSFAATTPSFSTRADDVVLEYKSPQTSTIPLDRLPDQGVIPFRLYGNGLALCGNSDNGPAQTGNGSPAYNSTVLSPAKIRELIGQITNAGFLKLETVYPKGIVPIDELSTEIQLNINNEAYKVNYQIGKQAKPLVFIRTEEIIKSVCRDIKTAYQPTTLQQITRKLPASANVSIPTEQSDVLDATPLPVANNENLAQTIKGPPAAKLLQRLNSKNSRLVTKNGTRYETKVYIELPKVRDQSLPIKNKSSLKTPKSNDNTALAASPGGVKIQVFCATDVCAPNTTASHSSYIQAWYYSQVGRGFRLDATGIYYGRYPASYYLNNQINPNDTVPMQRALHNIQAEVGNPSTPTIFLLAFSTGYPRSWCGLAYQPPPTDASSPRVGVTDASDPGPGLSCSYNGYATTTLAHELGHTFGLAHQSSPPNDLMATPTNQTYLIFNVLTPAQVQVVLSTGFFYLQSLSNRIDNFARGPANTLVHKYFDGANWSGWEDLGGTITSGPTVSSWSRGRLDVFARGVNGSLTHKWYDSAWSGWEDLGGGLAIDSAPAAVSWGPNRIDVFVRGTDNGIYHKWYDSAWSGWEPLGGVTLDSPTAATDSYGVVHVFVRGTDNQLWHKWYANGWHGWEPLGGYLTSAPAAVSDGPNSIHIYVRGGDNQLWHKWWNNGWSGWEPLGGYLTSAPAVSSWGAGRFDVFARGGANTMMHKFYQYGWSGWEDLGGNLNSAPAAVSWR